MGTSAMLDPTEERARILLERYETEVRGELNALGSHLVPDLDAAAALLRAAVASKREVRVGFLGESQVGKSSLINALIGRLALPTGGVGPLTAQATRLRHSATPTLDVRYHDRRRLNHFVFALRQYIAARGELVAPPEDVEESGDDVTAAAWLSASSVETGGSAPPRTEMGEHLLEQARLMLGASSLSNAAVHDAIRAVLGLETGGDPNAFASCVERIAEIRDLVGGATSITASSAGARAFGEMLQTNAAGWRSPLVAELDLALDVELLARVEVVDLPGVGVVGDPAGRVAEAFVRDDASALVIVARNNGLTQEVVGLLERTGVITRLLFGGESARTNPIHIIFAITRLDDVAQDRWKQERAQAKQDGLPPPSREDVFRRLSGEMEAKAKEQIRKVLAGSSQFEDLSPEMRARREAVVVALCERAEVICVSAKDFTNLESDDEEEQALAFLRDGDATNIPHFRERLAQLAESARGTRRGRIHRALESFRDLLASHVDALAVGASLTGTTDADRFTAALEGIVPKFRQQATVQRREVSQYLTEQIPPKLEEVTLEAATMTRKRLARLRRKGEGLHWASLNAALVRNGTWNKHAIDYPGDLTTGFVEVIAAAWEPSILDEVRRVIRKLMDDHVELVETFLSEASKLSGGDRLVTQLAAQKRLLKEQGKSAVGWTAEQLSELSEDVRKKLGAVVSKHLEKACLQAAKAGENTGVGARKRILDVFENGGNAAIDRAKEQSDELLNDRFRALRSSLGRLLRENDDPISQCYEAIVRDGAQRAEEAGREDRERVAAAITRIRSAMETSVATDAPVPTNAGAPALRTSSSAMKAATPSRDAASDIFATLAEAP